MNYISDILFWISTGLLIPVIVLLILLFGRALLLIGSFFGQYLSVRKAQATVNAALNAGGLGCRSRKASTQFYRSGHLLPLGHLGASRSACRSAAADFRLRTAHREGTQCA